MFKAWLTSDHPTMDVRLQANAQPHHRVNGDVDRNSRPADDDMLRFLSQEEQECLQFFERTIDSLEESLEVDEPRPRQAMTPASSSLRVEVLDGPAATSSPDPKAITSSLPARPPSPKDQDIIDLVRPEPDLVQHNEPMFNPTNPDFQSLVQTPDRHIETKPRHDLTDNLPSEYNPPLPSGSYDTADGHSSYHPPGCIPTPVLIAQKIAENQAGGTSKYPSAPPGSRRSLESEKPPSSSADLNGKQGPATSTKPNRFPANISMVIGNKENQNQSLASVNIQERRAQMLSNLSGTSHPLLVEDLKQNEEQKARNVPTRSVSFRDPTPEKSRMEALSKLGLNRNRASSGGISLPDNTDGISAKSVTVAEAVVKPPEISAPPTTETGTKLPDVNITPPTQSQIIVDRKPEILRSLSPRSHEHRKPQVSQPPLEKKASVPPPAEVTSLEFNTFGGKSISVNPSVSSKSEPSTSPSSSEPQILPAVLANPSELNNYGGKTKVMTPVTRNDLPDILSSHIDKSYTLPAKLEHLPTELNSYGGKSRTIHPSPGFNRASDRPAKTLKPPAPTPAPRPPRHSYHSSPQKPKAPSPDHKRRSNSMFRPQGITVQFSGRGATDESRREALRKLGLLKES